MSDRYVVVVFKDPGGMMDSGCSMDILSEIQAHGGVVEAFFDLPASPALAPDQYPGASDAMWTVPFADPTGRLC